MPFDPTEALRKIASGCTTDPAATAQDALDRRAATPWDTGVVGKRCKNPECARVPHSEHVGILLHCASVSVEIRPQDTGFVGKRCEKPECTRMPHDEHVGILLDRPSAALASPAPQAETPAWKQYVLGALDLLDTAEADARAMSERVVGPSCISVSAATLVVAINSLREALNHPAPQAADPRDDLLRECEAVIRGNKACCGGAHVKPLLAKLAALRSPEPARKKEGE